MVNSKVSVIVPIHNAMGWLPECINSILRQSYRDLEVILINDGSTDASGEICKYFVDADERVCFVNAEQRGVSVARNIGLKYATGGFIMFVDADDFVEPDAILNLVGAADGFDMVVGSFQKFGAFDGLVTSETRAYTRYALADYVLENLYNPRKNQMLSGCWAKLFRKDILSEKNIRFNTLMTTAEDMDFNFNYLLHCNNVKFLSGVVYHNRKHAYCSLSTKYDASIPGALFFFEAALASVKQFLCKNRDERDAINALAQSYIYHTILYFIRVCGQTDGVKLIRNVVSTRGFAERFFKYKAAPGNYRLIPALIWLGWVPLIAWACRREAKRIYG